MRAINQGGLFRKSSRTSLIGLGLFGLVLASALIYNHRSFDSYARAYDQALMQTGAWENRLSDILTIRGRMNGIVESVSQMDANSYRPIDEAVSDLKTVWVHHGASLPMISKTKVSMGIDMIALAAMRTSDELRRNNLDEALVQAQNVIRLTADVSPVLLQLEGQLTRSRQGSETDRQNALTGMRVGQTIDVSILFVLGVAFVGLLALSFPGFAGRGSHQPQHAVVTTSRGFSLVEVLMVVAITLVLSTIAIANIAAVVSSSRIHAGVSSMSGLFQNCRMMAVKKNKTMTCHVTTIGAASLLGYVKEATDTSELSTTDSQVKWEAPVVRMSSPTGPGAPDVITASVLGFTPQTGDISFNSRGLPCAYSSGVCTNYGFLYYFKDTSREGAKGWAALSVSPAGKIKKYFWNISSWIS
jgi:prepilin-type N-terminal cleavage/methylation domain-containing protein